MAGIWNVNSVYNSMQKKISGKISFQVGENIALRIISKGEDGKSIIVKTLDGWMFPALLEEPLEFSPDMLIRMQVSGYEQGKIKLKVLGQKHDGEAVQEESLFEIAQNNNLHEEDMDTLKAMVRYSMPLTRENISRIKSLAGFMDKINSNESEIHQFISMYLSGKNIGPDSEKGKEITNILKSFFDELKTLSLNDVLCMEENEIELNTDNINSFKNLVHEQGGLKSSLEAVKKEIVNNSRIAADALNENMKVANNVEDEVQAASSEIIESELQVKPQMQEQVQLQSKLQSQTQSQIGTQAQPMNTNQNSVKNNGQRLETLKNYLKDTVMGKIALLPPEKRDMLEKQISRLPMDSLAAVLDKQVNNTDGREPVKTQSQIEKKVLDALEIFIGSDLTFGDEEVKNIIKLVKNKDTVSNLKQREFNHDETFSKIAADIKDKLDEIKNIIKSIIDMKNDMDGTAWKDIAANIKTNINDIKTFNSISGQYYYMDMPLKLYEKDYPCKLIIKDDRKKGKRIDSTNVKMALSIATVNLGIVDAYVAVRDKSMKVDFKCDEKCMNIIDMAKEKLWKILSDSGYNISIKTYKREIPLSIVSCRDFFEGIQNSNINVKV